jgi:hypothetical protein
VLLFPQMRHEAEIDREADDAGMGGANAGPSEVEGGSVGI